MQGIIVYSFIQLKVSYIYVYITSDYRAFTEDLYSDGCICLHDNIEGESYSFQTLNEMGAECEAETTSQSSCCTLSTK